MRILKIRQGFSFVELLLYITLFITASVMLVGILESVTRIQGRESAVVAVTSESNFVIQTIQRVVRDASVIEDASSSLRLRMKTSTKDPTRIYLSGNTVYIQEGNSAAVELTTDKVTASGLTFIKFSNPPSKDAVQIDLTIAYNTSNPRSVFSKTLRSAISKVSAVTFDSDLIPSTANLKVGTGAQKWQDANYSGAVAIDSNLTVDTNTFFVDATNDRVGIGTTGPQRKLSVIGSVQQAQFNNSDALRGLFLTASVGASHYSWQVGAQQNVNAGFEITPSTATGGASFTTPAFVILASTGNVGIGTSSPAYILDVQHASSKINSKNGYLTNGADYAEYFQNEEHVERGSLVGINLQTGKVRAYKAGDAFLGIVTTNSGFIGNANAQIENDAQYTLVGLLGQLDFNSAGTTVQNRIIYTKDGHKIGVLLANGKAFIQ